MISKIILKTLFAFLLIIGISVLPASAWQLTMSDVNGTLTKGETYTISVDFEGNATDMLDMISFAIEWDTSLIELADYPALEEYNRGSGFNTYTLWGESSISSISDIDNGRWYDVAAETNLDHMGEFFPVATGETLMATFTFTALESGSFQDLAHFYFTPEDDLTERVDINGRGVSAGLGELQIYNEGSTSVMAPVPVPAAVWLLGSGLLSLVGFRRQSR